MNDTAREVATQPELWRRGIAQADEARTALGAPGRRMLVLGCGTSWFVAQSLADLREAAGLGETDAVCASEFVARRRYDAVVAISRSGTSTEVLDALRRVPAGVERIAVTGAAGQPIDALVDRRLLLDFADERSIVQTRFPTTLLTLLRARLGDDARAQAELVSSGEQATKAEISEAAPRQLVVLASGWAAALAQEAALKCRESAGMWAEAYATGEYRHGPISAARPGTLVWAMTPLSDVEIAAIEATGARIHHGGTEPQAELVLLQRHAIAWAAAAGRDADVPVHLTRSVVAL
jgi:fructoselysine-6-P-deglycase FrlB-like protein